MACSAISQKKISIKMAKKTNSGARYAAHFFMTAALSTQAWAALSPADIEAARQQQEQVQRQQQEQILREQQLRQPRSTKPGGIDASKLAPKVDGSQLAGKCRDISRIVIKDAPNIARRLPVQISEQYAGKCLGVPEVEQILGEITRAYMLRGFVTTRAYLPAQDLSQGDLEIRVMEGRIENLRIEEKGRKGFRAGNTIPAQKGDLLNLRDLEQGLDQINRMPSNRATLDIAPGSEPGLSDVIIRNEPSKYYRWNLSADNQGSASTGKGQVGVSVSSDNFFGLSEFILLTHRQSLPADRDAKHSKSDSVMLTVPYGYNTFSYNGSASSYTSTLRAPSGLNLISEGNSTNNTLSWDRVVFRNQSTRANVSAAFTVKDTKNYLEGQYLGVSSRKLSVMDLDANVSTGLWGGVVSANLGWSEGLKAAGALRDPAGLPDFVPRAQFEKIRYGASYFLPLRLANREWTLNSTLTGQKGVDTLYGSEQISIGGIYSVRGFVKNTLSGDSGYYLRNDLSTRQLVTIAGQPLAVRMYAGIDTGSVRNRVAGVPQGALVGSALGASVNWKGASWDISATCPLATPQNVAKESCQTWFRLNYSL